ncbi:uncharacterized protein [Watersipora subatra]|uniref:uncharacterized protein n=1 Tax=Watersipora subatra TaxID=2589382 RepID=UPI00355C7960
MSEMLKDDEAAECLKFVTEGWPKGGKRLGSELLKLYSAKWFEDSEESETQYRVDKQTRPGGGGERIGGLNDESEEPPGATVGSGLASGDPNIAVKKISSKLQSQWKAVQVAMPAVTDDRGRAAKRERGRGRTERSGHWQKDCKVPICQWCGETGHAVSGCPCRGTGGPVSTEAGKRKGSEEVPAPQRKVRSYAEVSGGARQAAAPVPIMGKLSEVQRRIAGSRLAPKEGQAEVNRSGPIPIPSSVAPPPELPIMAQGENSHRMPVRPVSTLESVVKTEGAESEVEESLLAQLPISEPVESSGGIGGGSVVGDRGHGGGDRGHGGGDGGHGGGDRGHGGGDGSGGDQASSAAEYDSSPGLLESDGTQDVLMDEDLG